MSKALFKLQKLIEQPKSYLSKQGVKWPISELIKIRDQGVE